MTIKEATANSLLMFVAATCVVLIVRALPQSSPVPPSAAGIAEGSVSSSAAPMSDGVIVYYLHGQARCPTCRTIEAYAHEAVQSGFAEDLKKGSLQWKVVNYQTPENEHFAKEFGLLSASVVLVKIDGGQQVAWKLLPEVWDLWGDKPAFLSFVQKALREFQEDPNANSAPVESSPASAATGNSESPLPIPE